MKANLLFDPEAYRCAPGPATLLKELSRRKPASLTQTLRRAEEDHAAIERLKGMGAELAGHFGLRYSYIEAERDGEYRHYGVCYRDGVIRIRLRHATTGRLLKDSSLVDTLCHELAHLKHFDHSKRFRRFYEKILREARRRGWYRPGPERPARGQLALFEAPDDGETTR